MTIPRVVRRWAVLLVACVLLFVMMYGFQRAARKVAPIVAAKAVAVAHQAKKVHWWPSAAPTPAPEQPTVEDMTASTIPIATATVSLDPPSCVCYATVPIDAQHVVQNVDVFRAMQQVPATGGAICFQPGS